MKDTTAEKSLSFMLSSLNHTENIMETVFVGNLSYFAKKEDLISLFSTFGVVHSAAVRKGRRDAPLYYGFVLMNIADAQRAVVDLNGIRFLGRRLKVSLCQGFSDQTDSDADYISLHVSFVTVKTDTIINESYLSQIFGAYGGLEDCVVKQHMLSYRKKRQGGYAFLYFKSMNFANNALAAVQAANGLMDEVVYDCKLSFPKSSHVLNKDGKTSPNTDKTIHNSIGEGHSPESAVPVTAIHVLTPGLPSNLPFENPSLAGNNHLSTSTAHHYQLIARAPQLFEGNTTFQHESEQKALTVQQPIYPAPYYQQTQISPPPFSDSKATEIQTYSHIPLRYQQQHHHQNALPQHILPPQRQEQLVPPTLTVPTQPVPPQAYYHHGYTLIPSPYIMPHFEPPQTQHFTSRHNHVLTSFPQPIRSPGIQAIVYPSHVVPSGQHQPPYSVGVYPSQVHPHSNLHHLPQIHPQLPSTPSQHQPHPPQSSTPPSSTESATF